jgi:FkbM family methyltransferase
LRELFSAGRIFDHDYFVSDEVHKNIIRLLRVSRKCLESLNLCDIYGPDKVYLDCGASTGIESISYLNDFGAIHSFEPGSRDYICLRENLKHYSNCTSHNAALSDENSTATLVNYSSGRINHLDFLPTVKGRRVIGTSTVATRTLDSYDFANVSYIKIDVEGGEYNLLQGAKELLKNNNPLIKIEISNRHNEVVDLLLSMGYNIQGFVMDRRVYPLDDAPVFFESPDYPNQTFWKSGDHFSLADFKDHHKKEFERYTVIPPYNPNWGDFYFRKS